MNSIPGSIENFSDMPQVDLIYNISINTSDMDSLFWHVYNAKTFFKWFCVPTMFFSSKYENFQPGGWLQCAFIFPPFKWFRAEWNELVNEEKFKAVKGNFVFKDRMTGTMLLGVKKSSDNECILLYEGRLKWKNRFWHNYYKSTLVFAHDIQTPYVMKKLKKKFEEGSYSRAPENYI